MTKKIMLLLLFLFLSASIHASASSFDWQEELDFTELEKVIADTFHDDSISFRQMIEKMVKGESPVSIKTVLTWIKNACLHDLNVNRKAVILLFGVGIMAAIFHTISIAFSNQQIADTSFFITYLAFMTISMAAFQTTAEVAANALSSLESFMRALVPAFFIAVTFTVGSGTAVGFYQLIVLLMSLVNGILLAVIIPCIKISVVLVMINNITKEDILTKLSEFFQIAVQWGLKTLLAMIIALNTIQGLVLPKVDGVKTTLLQKSIQMIPGIGNSAEAVADIMAGSGMLIKNGIGTAAFLFLGITALIPIVKIGIFVLLYQFVNAILEPISDKRVVGSLSGICEGAKLLLHTVVTAAILFMITIAIVCAATNFR